MEITIKGNCPHCGRNFEFGNIFTGTPRKEPNEVEQLTFKVIRNATIKAVEKEKNKSKLLEDASELFKEFIPENKTVIHLQNYFLGLEYQINTTNKKELIKIKKAIIRTKPKGSKEIQNVIISQRNRLLGIVNQRLKLMRDADNAIQLKVSDAISDDIPTGIVRIDTPHIKKLKIKVGDTIAIYGDRKTYAIVGNPYPGDRGLSIIKMDKITRRNARAVIGNFVYISKVKLPPAKKVIIENFDDAPFDKDIKPIKRDLKKMPVSEGDIISPFLLGDIKFVVIRAYPKNSIIDDKTEMIVY